MKKFVSWLLAAVLMVAAIPVCFAAATTEPTKVEIEDLDMEMEVPAGMFILTADTPIDSTDWGLAGYDDPLNKVSEFEEDDSGNVMAMELVPEDRSYNVRITRKYSDESKNYFNLNEVTDEQFQELLDANTFVDEEYGVTAKAEKYEHSQIPFFKLDLQGEVDGNKVWETCYGTIVNGFSLSVDMYGNDEFTDEQIALVEQLVDSITITKFLEKPTQSDMMLQMVMAVLPVVIIIALAVVFLLAMRYNTRKKEQAKKEMTDMLVAYRKEQAQRAAQDEHYQVSKTLFENTTFCSDAAAQEFCKFHGFRRCLPRNIMFIVLGALSVVVGFIYNDNWFLRIIMIALGIYLVVQPFMMLDKMKRAEVGFYKKARSREASYAFREEDFRISGIQSVTLYPYFQILSAYEDKKYFYLYYTEDRAYLVEKGGFTMGEAKDFRSFLKEKLGKNCHWK